jgi:two-component system LytT family response regulator
MRKQMSAFSDYRIVAEAERLGEARKLVAEHSPDLVLLDIELFGESGFDLLDDIPENTKVIFVTAFNEYALRAFEVNALDYLLKPVSPERLEKALKRMDESDEESAVPKPAEAALPMRSNDKVYLQHGRKRWFEPIDSIIAICAEGDYSVLLLNNVRRVVMRRTLGEWGNYLPTDLFMRIHKATIVNLSYVTGTEQREDGLLSVRLRGIPGAVIASGEKASELERRIKDNA